MLALAESQQLVVQHGAGPLLVRGPDGSGKTEALARRLARLAADGTGPERVLVLASTAPTARRLRERAEALIEHPYEEMWVGTWGAICERLLREWPVEAGLDPFFDVVGRAERLAMLLDSLDELPLRRHEIRGNPAGLLAGLLRRIDELKAEAVGPSALAREAKEKGETAQGGAAREAAQREHEFAELYAAHDEILGAAGSLDCGDVFLALRRLLHDRPDVRAELTTRFPHVMVDELEAATPAQSAILEEIKEKTVSLVCAVELDATLAWASDEVADTKDDHSGARTSPSPDRPRTRERASEIAGSDERERAGAEEAVVDAGSGGRAGDDAGAEEAAVDVVELTETFRQPEIRFWKCANERAQAQALAREVEHLIGAGTPPELIGVLVEDPPRQGGAVSAAMEERSIPFRIAGPAALFDRPEVRDAVAWLRLLAAPDDSAAAARALTRPPVELRSVDLAKLTTIARRRKLDMVSAAEAALGSPQVQPEARERIQSFLKLYRAASVAMEERRADVFVRRLIERVGLRRQRLFAAQPEAAERLLSLSRLAEIASAWARREPHGSTRDFVRYLSAVAEAGVEVGGGEEPAPTGAVQVLSPGAVKGMEFDHLYALGLEAAEQPPPLSRARDGLVLSRLERDSDGAEVRPSRFYEEARVAREAEEEAHAEELFGPAEGLHASYRVLRDEVLEASWKAGRELSEPRLDTAVDVNRAIARYLELLKLAALAQRPGEEPDAEAIEAVNGLLAQVATPDQLAELEASSLDSWLLEEERERGRRRASIAAREEPSLEAFLPRAGDGGLKLSASDLGLYLTCPLKYKFARVFGIPQEPTINQRFGILVHNVLERFHKDREEGTSEEEDVERLMRLFEAGWRRSGFGGSDDELQFRDRAREALRLYPQREREGEGDPVWLERKFDFKIGPHHLRGRVDRVDRLPGGEYELIDYKTGERKSEEDLAEDLQLALYRLAAREAWDVEARAGSYYYVLDAEKVAVGTQPDDAERVERTVLGVAEGINGQDFEPRPSPSVCSWCDYRLICPAAET